MYTTNVVILTSLVNEGLQMRSKVFLFMIFFAFPVPRAHAQPAGPAKAEASWPDGTGDPDGTTCRPPQPVPGSRLPGPEVCKLNSEWALLRMNRQDISADGKQIIPDPKGSNIAPMNCNATGGATTGGRVTCQ
jgi:hypothetical protein